MSTDNNITFSLDETQLAIENEYNNVANILEQIENLDLDSDLNLDYAYDLQFPQMINYNENYTVKELLHICDYYAYQRS